MRRILLALFLAGGIAAGPLLSGCQFSSQTANPAATDQATTQPDEAAPAITASRPDEPAGPLADATVSEATPAAQATPAIPAGTAPQIAPPTTIAPAAPALAGGVDDVGSTNTSSASAPPLQIIQTQPDSPLAGSPDQGMLPVGLPPGVKPEFTMPGRGTPPLAGDQVARKRGAIQAALAAAIYNVTAEVNTGAPNIDKIEKGYVRSDDFCYHNGDKPGLEVKSETVVREGKVKQFDVWLVVPPGSGQEGFQVHTLNFRLVGDAMDSAKVAHLLGCAGGHLAVTQVSEPDDQGGYSVEVGLVRKPK